MKAAILTIGTEITRGEIVDTNASWLARELTKAGFEICAADTVDDHEDRIIDAFQRLSNDFKFIFVTGGLGPTTDDITANCASKWSCDTIVVDQNALVRLELKLNSVGRKLNEVNIRQTHVPSKAIIFQNPAGMAPGFCVEHNDARLYFMPGVPDEMKAIFKTGILPALAKRVQPKSFQYFLRVYGLPESEIGERLQGLEESHPGLNIGYRVSFPEVFIKILVNSEDLKTSTERATLIKSQVEGRLDGFIYGEGEETSYLEHLVALLKCKNKTLGVAESCTGGLISQLLTEVPGSSSVFGLGMVTYANEAKENLLGVNKSTFERFGAVSAECVKQMATKIVELAQSDYGIAVSGIAGPTGGSEEKPVGLVHFAMAKNTGELTLKEKRFLGSRTRVQKAAAFYALELVRRDLLSQKQSPL